MTVFKMCNSCDQHQTLKSFSKRPDGREGYRAVCKKCMTKKSSKYYTKNKVSIIHRRKILAEVKEHINLLKPNSE